VVAWCFRGHVVLFKAEQTQRFSQAGLRRFVVYTNVIQSINCTRERLSRRPTWLAEA
jgi:hypothetical protein